MNTSKKTGCRSKGCVIPIASVTLLIAIFVGREIYIAFTATPGSAINYFAKSTELVQQYQPAPRTGDNTDTDENGWHALIDAVDAYNAAAPTDTSDIAWSEAFEFTLNPAAFDPQRDKYTLDQYRSTAEQALPVIAEQGVYDHLDRLAAANRYERPLPTSGTLILLMIPELSNARDIAHALTLEIRHANDRADNAAEVRATVQALALAKALSHQHTLIDRIVAMRIIDLVLRELRASITDRPLPQRELAQLAKALDRYQFPSMTLTLEGERLNILDIIQSTHTDDGHGNGRLIVSRVNINGILGNPTGETRVSTAITNLKSFNHPTKKQTTTHANDLFDSFQHYLKLTRSQRTNSPSSPDIDIMELPTRQILLKQIMPAFGQAYALNDQYHSVIAGTRVMIALEQFNAQNGTYPKSLNELTPNILPSLPTDPFAIGGQFIYRTLNPTTDQFARPYILYSIGYDGTDDNGTPDPKDDIAAFRYGASAIDYIFNLPTQTPDDK